MRSVEFHKAGRREKAKLSCRSGENEAQVPRSLLSAAWGWGCYLSKLKNVSITYKSCMKHADNNIETTIVCSR